jgi:hypothetical protein
MVLEVCGTFLSSAKRKNTAQLCCAAGPGQSPQSRQVSGSWQASLYTGPPRLKVVIALGSSPTSKIPWRQAMCPWWLSCPEAQQSWALISCAESPLRLVMQIKHCSWLKSFKASLEVLWPKSLGVGHGKNPQEEYLRLILSYRS